MGLGFQYARPFNNRQFLQFEGDGRAWIDFNFGIGALRRGSAAPDLIDVGSTDIETLGFDGVNTLEEVSNALELNHNWAEGTTLRPHVHWYPTTNDAGNVKWNMDYVIVSSGAVVGAATTISVTQAAGGVAWTERYAALPDITTAGLVIGAQMHLRLYRDPNDEDDTYGADAALATFGLHVLIDSLGSSSEATK